MSVLCANMAKDVNPQFFNMNVDESAANTYTETEFQTPVHEAPGGGRNSMEIMKIIYELEDPDNEANQNNTTISHITHTTEADTLALNDRESLMVMKNINHNIVSGVQLIEYPRVIDLTDGKGNGVIYPHKAMFVAVKGIGNAGATTFRVKILYKFKRVTAQELIGFFQD